MGTWGTGLSSNDTFADVYGEFIELYAEGQDIREITDHLISVNRDLLTGKADSNNFWFAVAKAQWECKSLDQEVFSRVKDIVESKNDLDVWRELGADEQAIKKREEVLKKFLRQLGSDKEKPKARKKRR